MMSLYTHARTHTHTLYNLNGFKFTALPFWQVTVSRCRSVVQDVSVCCVLCVPAQPVFRLVFPISTRRSFSRSVVQK
jgi:hypothetical protein